MISDRQPRLSTADAARFSGLEDKISALQSRANGFKKQLEDENDDKQKLAAKLERKKRQQLTESKMKAKGQLPESFLPPEVKQQLENTQAEMRQRASGGSWFKSFFVWAVLAAILWVVIKLWKGLNENERKFKD